MSLSRNTFPVIFFAVLSSFPSPAGAANFEVTIVNDSGPGSLRNAIAAANGAAGDDTITFAPALAGQTIDVSLNGQLEVTASERLVVSAAGLANPVTISALASSRVFLVAAGAELELVDLVIADGLAPGGSAGTDGAAPSAGGDGESGGGIHNSGTLILTDCIVEACSAGNGGRGGHKTGAALADSGNGGRGGHGGGIYSTGAAASVRLENTTLRQNDAGNGGSAGRLSTGAGGGIGVPGTGGNGGGIFLVGGTLEVITSRVESNGAGTGGGGGENQNGGVGGSGGRGGNGGGIAMDGGDLAVTDSTIQSNSAGIGGIGGDDFGSAADTRGAGGVGGDGGGLWVRNFATAATAHLSGSLVHQNQAGSGRTGGDSPNLGNGETGTAGGDGGNGGGLFVIGDAGSVWKMRNSTVVLNFAGDGGSGGDGSTNGSGGAGGEAGNGGGIAFSRDAADYTAVLTHLSVISNNAGLAGQEGAPPGAGDGAGSSGGGIWEFPGGINAGPGITLANSVVANNDANVTDNVGSFTAVGNNHTAGDPELGGLSDNGGPTLTMPPIQGSLLLDGGATLVDPLTVDQRGEVRPFNGLPDLGAFEAKFQPDARIGSSSNPATHFIDNFYTVSGAGQLQAVKLSGTKRSYFYLSVQNDGEVGDDLSLNGTPVNRTLKLTALDLSSGGANITAQLATGKVFAGVAAGAVAVVQLDVKARSKKVRAKQTLGYSVRSSLSPSVDSVVARVTQKKAR